MSNMERIETENVNERTKHIDQLSTYEMVRLINDEDKKVAYAVEKVLPEIAKAIELTENRLKSGGRLIYCGCGTSGRIGILDAVECPPTYSTEKDLVQGLIAGGKDAMFEAVEGAEDNKEGAILELIQKDLSKKDVLVGISASGRTPYVIGAVEYAKKVGSATISISCCNHSLIGQISDVDIAPLPGPEVITGSTRMKSGTAQKMVLNMLSTGVMIRLGKVYGNLMVDVKPSNQKLIQRSIVIVCKATGVDEITATRYLEQCEYHPKMAIVMIQLNVDAKTAKKMLNMYSGNITRLIMEYKDDDY